MLKQATALFVALLVGLAVFAWVESYSSSFQNCVSHDGAKAVGNQSGNQKDSLPVVVSFYVRCTERFADLHNALITALSTVLLTVITLGLILSGVDQQATTRAQLRAYVMIESVAITGISDGQKPDVHISIKNSGQTPASYVTHWAKLGCTTFPEMSGPIPRRDPSETLPESAMAPGAILNIITGVDRELNAATIRAIKAQTHALYVIGEIRYIDAFGTPRDTDFLLFCTGHLADSGSAASYKTGNRIT
jgi:hypothetical protein